MPRKITYTKKILLTVLYDGEHNPTLDRAIFETLGEFLDGAGYGFGQRDVTARVPRKELSRIVGALKRIPQIKIELPARERAIDGNG
jgi:hypothetical protein